MSLRRFLIRTLDRRGGRSILGLFATRYARARTNCDLRVFYDEVWAHRVASWTLADSSNFDYWAESFDNMSREPDLLQREAEDYWFHLYKPQHGDVIVDVGAGKGEHLLPFSHAVGPSGKVIAIEAHPETYRMLRRTAELNKLTNVVTLNCAVAEERGRLVIDTAAEWYASTVQREDSTNSGTFEIEAVTLDGLLASQAITTVTFLKMNIEGAEASALTNLSLVAERINHICVACHDFRADRGEGEQYRTRSEVSKLLDAAGFSPVLVRTEDPRPYVRDHIHARRRFSSAALA